LKKKIKKPFRKMKLRTKAVLYICLNSVVVAFMSGVLAYTLMYDLRYSMITQHHKDIIVLAAKHISNSLSDRIDDIKAFSSSFFWKDFIIERNKEYAGMSDEEILTGFEQKDKEWIEADPAGPLVEKYTGNTLGRRLKQIAEERDDIAEIFVTDKFGGLAASSGKTSDFYQADEKWWQESFTGNVFMGDIGFDKSTGVVAIIIAVPIMDKNGETAGVCKAVIDVTEIWACLEGITFDKTGNISVIAMNGDIIFRKGIEPLSRKWGHAGRIEDLLSSDNMSHRLYKPDMGGRSVLVTVKKIEPMNFSQKDIEWIVFSEQEFQEVFDPVRKIFGSLSILVLVLTTIVFFIGLIFVKILVKPMGILHEGMEHIARGELDYRIDYDADDEVGEFTKDFNKMTENLSSTTASLAALNREIEERKKAEKVLKESEEELNIQAWGLKKTNEAISLLYKELEKKNVKLRELDSMKSDFISNVSHELRTPLAITKEGISLVLDGVTGEINPKQDKMLSTAKQNIDRLARIINNLLDISKIEAGGMELAREMVDMVNLVKQIAFSFQVLALEKQLEIRVDIPENAIDVFVDKDKIIQVFTNLVGNAMKFTRKGYIKISVRDRKDEVECSVEDTGAGMKKEDLAQVFDKFHQVGRTAGSGEKGTGLGLTIAKQIVELHGGRIHAASRFGEGSEFTFTLPKDGGENGK